MRRLARKKSQDVADVAWPARAKEHEADGSGSCVRGSNLAGLYRCHSSKLTTAMAETTLFLVCILLIAALGVSASSLHHVPSSAHAQAASSVRVATSSTWTCDAMMKMPRGGAAVNGSSTGGGRFGRLPFVRTRVNRRAELQEEVRTLESKLRKSYDEVSILRTQLRSASSSDRSASAKLVREGAAIRQQLKDEVDVLRDMVEKLEAARSEMEEMLTKETERADAAEARAVQVESRAKVEMEQLRTTLLNKSKKELEAAEEAAEKRLEMEVKRLEEEADKRVEEAKQKGIKALEDERERSKEAIEAEQARSKAAVDSEKSKMKKVLKAIATEGQSENAPVDADTGAVKSGKKSKKKNSSAGGSSSSSGKKKKKKTTITGASASRTTAGGKKSVSSVRGTTY